MTVWEAVLQSRMFVESDFLSVMSYKRFLLAHEKCQWVLSQNVGLEWDFLHGLVRVVS